MGQSITKPKIISFDLANEVEAVKMAREIAAKTGHVVTVRSSDGAKIQTVVPTKH